MTEPAHAPAAAAHAPAAAAHAPAAAAHAPADGGGKKEKPTLIARLVGIILATLAVVVFLYFMGSLLGMGFSAANGLMITTNQGMSALGATLMNTGQSLSELMLGWIMVLIRLTILILGSVFIFMMVKKAVEAMMR